MFERDQLVYAVIWPSASEALVQLIDTDGVVVAAYPVLEPLKGSEVIKMVPDGYCLGFERCHVVKTTGSILVNTGVKFDTAVVTERAEVTFEERMARLERRERRREQRELVLEQQLKEALKRRDEALAPPPDKTDEQEPVTPDVMEEKPQEEEQQDAGSGNGRAA